MENLPLLPGYSFQDSNIQDYRLLQKFNFLNGYRIVRDSNIGIGGRPIDAASTAYIKEEDAVYYDPSLTYGRVKQYAYRQFIPHYALFAQKCLFFKAFFRQGVFNSPDEHFRIRHVNVLYFLEDNTLCIIEPVINNAGFKQGKLVRRNKIVKNVNGDTFHWKDFNVGVDICIYGIVYHIIDCDVFTKEFLNSQGIDVGDKEEPPVDPYTELCMKKQKVPTCITQIPDDARRRFLEYDKMVLSFTAIWNDDVYRIMYFLTDDTIAVCEIRKPNSGKDPVPMLLKRQKVPKDWKNLSPSYPGAYMECGDSDIIEYYTPKDFLVGGTVFILSRRFFLHDCDSFTRKYYSDMLGITQPKEIPLSIKEIKLSSKYKPPPHIIFGTPEDTYTSCLSFLPKPPKKDVVRQLLNFPNKLRYSMKMDVVHPEDKNRDFILEYSLSEGTILVHELEKRNSGRYEGCFLKATLVPKSKTGRDNPQYYTPQDFFIGAKINIFNHYFIINGADLFVYRYTEANPEKFPQEIRDNIRDYFVKQNLLREDIEIETKKLQDQRDTKLHSIKPAEATIEGDIMTRCINDLEAQVKCKYEGEQGELRSRQVPSEELCPNLRTTDPMQLFHQCQDSKIFTEKDTKKEVRWDDRVKQ
ncbi:EF-hand domain-containing protein 1 [Habropoda laboriosa]|uniref:EF-hand domain-containing protein 1 n=1 Tax=Habropoda laboriosa TaxID=597456 RepID=A0A0L7R3R8_9HYME|nr:PREDICTED: EF-hand domain-containing protein 1-like [Habropoda laboriosa]KOC65488.1 EF-hand domain-containing protein 1 [Habropoda laboriosa]